MDGVAPSRAEQSGPCEIDSTMEIQDSLTFLQQAVKLGLISEEHMREALEEAQEEGGKTLPDLPLTLRVLERKALLTNWQNNKILKGDSDGYYLGGYRVLYKISSGSFGRVFRAESPRDGRVVAIKVLRKRWSEDQQRIDLFIREGKVGMTLKHPNIVEVLAINQDPVSGFYYIVMEFVEGGNLREILGIRKTLAVPEALRITEDATSGLAYAYSRGITHRDIKLTNLLISSQGEAKLVDFGLAQMFAAIGREEEQVDRTVDYAGLEKATNVKHGDVRSDIYFLGCVTYEALTGRAPLTMTRDRHQRMAKRRFEDVKPLHPGEIDAPPSVYALVGTMMSLEPTRRYQTPAQLLDAVRAARREAGGKATAGQQQRPRSLFIAESNEALQNALREKFKERGYRVFMASDPLRALDRFRQQPYDALIVDAGTTGEDGLLVFERVLVEAAEQRIPCAAIVILNQDQADWADRVQLGPKAAVLVRPVTEKQLNRKLRELLASHNGQ
jgi:serine/threonine protein kinase